MSGDSNLLREGLDALARMLPEGCKVAPSSLSKRKAEPGDWIMIRHGDRHVTCLVISRRRVETRDLGAIAAVAARTNQPALLLAPYLTPSVRDRLRGFGIGHWDLTGNIRIDLPAIELEIAADGTGVGKVNRHSVRSLCGEMAGRVARVLVDVAPPYALGKLAEIARVESSYASRVLAYLTDTGLVERQQRGNVEKVDWQELLRRWSLDAPLETRGEQTPFTCPGGAAGFLERLGQSGFLHALTGEVAMARMVGGEVPATIVLYVDAPAEAVGQFRLHPADEGEIVLVKPADRSVYQRSKERNGLRCVSASLIAADLDGGERLEELVTWMAAHEAQWRLPASAFESEKSDERRKRRR